MALADQIRGHADRIQADLKAGHEYYEHTKAAWRLVMELADEGRPVGIQDVETGAVVIAAALPDLTERYVSGYLAESVFQHDVALFEDFVFSLLGAWLSAYPAGIPHKDRKAVDLAIILGARDKTPSSRPWWIGNWTT